MLFLDRSTSRSAHPARPPRSRKQGHRAVYLAAGTLTLALGSFVARPAVAQVTYGPGSGGALVDGTSTAVGVFNTDIVVNAASQTVTAFNSVTLTGLTHTYLGDLEIRLTKQGTGEFVILTSPPDLRSANFNGTYSFVVNPALQTIDEASAGLATTANIPSGSYAISQYGGGTDNGTRTTYTPFVGVALTGTWRLTISDFDAGDTGALGSWQFNATPSAVSAAAPEPSSIALLALSGLTASGMIVRRRRKAE